MSSGTQTVDTVYSGCNTCWKMAGSGQATYSWAVTDLDCTAAVVNSVSTTGRSLSMVYGGGAA